MGRKQKIDCTKLIPLLEKELKENYTNLTVAFEKVAKELGYNWQSVRNYWYGIPGMKQRPMRETHPCFFMKSDDDRIVINTKNVHRDKIIEQ